MTHDRQYTAEPATSTSLTLLDRLKDRHDHGSWKEFYHFYRGYVARCVRKSSLTPEEIDDVVQEVFRSVSIKFESFQPAERKGSFRRWLKNLTRWRTVDQLRQKARNPIDEANRQRRFSDDPQTATVELIPDSAFSDREQCKQEWQAQLLETALKRLAHKAPPHQFQVFQMHHFEGWSLTRIADELSITVANAYIINHRLKKALKREVERLENELRQ